MIVRAAAPPAQPSGVVLRAFGLGGGPLRPVDKTLLTVALVLTTIAAAASVTDVAGRYGGIDYRNRVVGARVLSLGMNPYTFVWEPGMPEVLLDPHHRDGVTRVTVPPTALCLYQVIAWVPYGTQRLLHFGLEWAALLASVAVLVRTLPTRGLRVAFLVGAAVFFAGGAAWRMHTERGQVYVFHLLFLSLGAARCLRTRLDSWRAGVAFGVAAALRPNFAPLALAFLVLGKYRTAGGAVGTGALAVALTLPWAGAGVWKSYFAMGDEYFAYVQERWNPYAEPGASRFGPPPWKVPFEAEGFTFEQVIVDEYSPPSSVNRFYSENRVALGLPEVDQARISKALLLGLVGVMVGVAALGRRRSPRVTLLFLSCLLLDQEYFLPHRWPYVDVHWLLPLALAAPALAAARPANRLGVVLILVGLVVGNALALSPQPYTTTLARTYLLALGLTCVAWAEWTRRRTGRAGAVPPVAEK